MADTKRYPCSDCGSSDGVMIDPKDGHAYCFACNKRSKEYGTYTRTSSNQFDKLTIDDISRFSSLDITSRHIERSVVEYFKVKTHVYDNKPAHFYPYGNTGYKIRILPKEFRIIGKLKGLFGQSIFPKSGNMLVITEGELDALSVAQASFKLNNKIWPVVSIPSANQLNELLNQRDWVRSFKTVVLWLDSDSVGKKAINQAAKIIGFDKVKVVDSSYKDANETLMKSGPKAVNEAIWGAKVYSPAGVLTGSDIWDQYQSHKDIISIPYPDCLNGLNKKLEGIRQGEITLFTSGTGSGKSTVLKEIIMDLVKVHKQKVGLVSLEESIFETTKIFLKMNKNTEGWPNERDNFNDLFGENNIVLLDHQGSVNDASLIDKIEYMALMGCTHIILDHITIAVSEGSEGLEGNAAIDKMMSDLLKVVKKHNIWLGLISHLRKSGGKAFEEGNMASIDDVKGSGSIKQISFDIIAFSRNLTATNEHDRNVIRFTVLKSRFTGLTGPAGSAKFNNETYRLVNNDSGFQIN